MKMYAIKHFPSGKYYYEDDGGILLINKDQISNFSNDDECCVVWKNKEEADEILDDMKSYHGGMIWTENGIFPVNEFEVTTI